MVSLNVTHDNQENEERRPMYCMQAICLRSVSPKVRACTGTAPATCWSIFNRWSPISHIVCMPNVSGQVQVRHLNQPCAICTSSSLNLTRTHTEVERSSRRAFILFDEETDKAFF